jgi:hypothetical protein
MFVLAGSTTIPTLGSVVPVKGGMFWVFVKVILLSGTKYPFHAKQEQLLPQTT